MSSYITGIPRAGQSLGNSRPQVQGNFDYINTTIKVNHYFNEANAGKHKFVDLVEQNSADPPVVAGASTLFTKSSGPFSPQFGELFYKRDSGVLIQMTYGNPSALVRGYSFLPGAILLQWGSVTTSSSAGSINFADGGGIDFNTSCFQVLISPTNGGLSPVSQITYSVNTSTLSTSKFDWTRIGGATNYNGFYWFAVGV